MKFFFDTNILVCLFDADSPDKRRKARAPFQKHAEAGDILLSTQVHAQAASGNVVEIHWPHASQES